MNSAFNRYLIFLVFAALGLSGQCLGTWGIRTTTWHVHVVNNLGPSRELVAHCESKNNDLGQRSLRPGTEFNWKFRMNYFGSTLYWCYMRTDHQHAAFDVFWSESDHTWLQYRCKEKDCFWIAKDDGIYLKNLAENRDELIHEWKQGW